jgi:tetratricopeptide (TPR) repeat protein
MVGKLVRAARAFILASACLTATAVLAQEAVLAEFYGTGVHHYFARRYDQAASDLDAAINGGSKDPRAYYFRALAELRRGDQARATADLQKGAALESADVNQFYPVGRSLERVQGTYRMTIERYRAVARAEAHERQQRREAIRYEQRRRAESEVLRKGGVRPPVAAPAPPAAQPPAAPPPAPGAESEDLFGDEDKTPPAKSAEGVEPDEAMPAEGQPPAAEAPEDMPDADAPAAESGKDDPFGDATTDEK